MTTVPPITSAAVSDQWIADCRQAMNEREGVPVRAHPTANSIQAWSINRRHWIDLMLPGSGTTFTTAEDRDAVLSRLS